ncbi:MAG: radical SAM protein [Clostridia bacterium]|jgi:heme b synthase|nr:radical SAM protein [Spirochaetia bacterium]
MPPLRLVAWETTRRCPLKCRHCRGSARDQDYEGELSLEEGKRLIDSIAEFAKPILILTGGEPMNRVDILDIARYATDKGFRVVMSPCGPLITIERAKAMKAAGIQRISISLDGAQASTHDEFRGVPGIFEQTIAGIEAAKAGGLDFQINTTVSTINVHELPELLDLSIRLGAKAFDAFFLVPTGRGREIASLSLSKEAYEEALRWVHQASLSAPIDVKPTCAPQYVRIAAEAGDTRRISGCMGGKGFVFVSYNGTLQPCGFLDIPCGNVRDNDFNFRELYEGSKVFQDIRNVDSYNGKCGNCSYVVACGGCRARAYEATGDYLAEEPMCAYQP